MLKDGFISSQLVLTIVSELIQTIKLSKTLSEKLNLKKKKTVHFLITEN